MTTNQTIDGVPRDDLEEVLTLGCSTQASRDAWDRLRALLDAPASVESLVGRTGGGMVWHECAVCHTKGSYHPDVKWCICGRLFEKPADKPYGEPVIHITPEALSMLRGERKMQSGGLTYSQSKPVGGWTVPLYADQPAHVRGASGAGRRKKWQS